MGGGRYSNREGRPVEPDELRARGNDPDAVEICDSGSGDGPRRVGEFREEREGVQGRTEGDEHLADRDAEANRGTSEAGRDAGGVAAVDPQEGWNIPSGVLPPIGSRDLPEPVPLGKLFGASVVILATAMGSGEFVIWPYITRANFVLRGF